MNRIDKSEETNSTDNGMTVSQVLILKYSKYECQFFVFLFFEKTASYLNNSSMIRPKNCCFTDLEPLSLPRFL
jgi:hypothetical protein